MYRIYRRFYDVNGDLIWVSKARVCSDLDTAIKEADRWVGRWGGSYWGVTNTEHPDYQIRSAQSVALLPTNICIKDEKGRFVPWRNI